MTTRGWSLDYPLVTPGPGPGPPALGPPCPRPPWPPGPPCPPGPPLPPLPLRFCIRWANAL
ncbi:MAG TPA: hypothetical protein DCY57_06070 [Bacteroidetes bacterium]|nr:hypothetical protein [Bacteroidota bacterium]